MSTSNGSDLKPLSKQSTAAFRTDWNATRVIACNDAFLRLTRSTSPQNCEYSDLVTHLFWLLHELREGLRGEGEMTERRLQCFEGEDSAQPYLSLQVSVKWARADGEDVLDCLAEDVTNGQGTTGPAGAAIL